MKRPRVPAPSAVAALLTVVGLGVFCVGLALAWPPLGVATAGLVVAAVGLFLVTFEGTKT